MLVGNQTAFSSTQIKMHHWMGWVSEVDYHSQMKKVNKQCLLDTPRTVRVGEKTWQVIVQTSRP